MSRICDYQTPGLCLLNDDSSQSHEVSQEELDRNKRRIVSTLKGFKIEVSEISVCVGPVVTLYEVEPAPGLRVTRIARLKDDIAFYLGRGVRVVLQSGKRMIGIEMPNDEPCIVSMRSVLSDHGFDEVNYGLPVAIGRTISNEVCSFDLAAMPHLLVAGATGQGKSVCLHAIITSLLYRKRPDSTEHICCPGVKWMIRPVEAVTSCSRRRPG